MENAKETKNPLLETYGTVVDRVFAPGKATQDPVVLFPGVASASQADELPYQPDLVHFDPGKAVVDSIQRTVEQLRTQLDREAKESLQLDDQKKKFANVADKVRVVRGQAEGIQQVSFHLEAFRTALQTGDESLLKGNPFYTLSKLIFRHTLAGTMVLFGHLLEELSANAPEQTGKTHSLQRIWQGIGKPGEWPSRITASLALFFQNSKLFLDGLLFFVSAFTSYRALLALLQSSGMTDWLLRYFSQSQGELLQITLSLLGSLALTIAILDFRARLLQGTAETGSVFPGLWAAIRLQPRWIFLAFCLTLFSVKANYESVSVLFSAREHLSASWTTIQQQVGAVLGTPGAVATAPPRSLYDIQNRMQSVVTELGEKFARIPEDELTGKSTTADPRKGPRYWAKYFIVNGGFVPGSSDVVRSFKNVQFARNMDQQLQEAGIPFDLSITRKLQTIAALYTTDLEKTTATVQKNLAELDRLMQVGTLSLPAIQKIYTFDNKQINWHIQEILQALNANRVRFDQLVQALDKLTESHIRILTQVDRSAENHFNTLRMAQHLTLPAEVPLGALSLSPVQASHQKGIAELTAFLGEQYGTTRGRWIMAWILFLSFAIDGLPLLLYCRATARQGRRDTQMAEELLAYMQEWENAFVELAKSFFYRPAIQQTFLGFTFPNETGVRNAFYKVLEKIDPNVKDLQDQDTMDQRRAWWRRLFVRPHTLYTMGYNARAGAIETFLSQENIGFPLLVTYLFPGLPYGKNSRQIIENDTFLSFYLKTEAGQALDKKQFATELEQLSPGRTDADRRAVAVEEPEQNRVLAFFSGAGQQLATLLHRIPLPGRKPVEEDPWASMMQKAVNSQSAVSKEERKRDLPPGEETPARQRLYRLQFLLLETAFREPYPPFPHTRRNWLIKMSSVDEESLEDLDTLHDFIPDFVKMLKKVMTNTLPIIQESLEPLEEIYNRFPDQCQAHGITGTAELQERFRALEKESLGMWGACVSHMLGDGNSINAQFQATDNPELAGLLAAGGDISQFYERIHTLMSDAKEAAKRAKAVEEATLATVKHSVLEIKELCESIGQMLIKINLANLELRRQRPLPHLKLRALNEAASILDRAPRHVKQILDAREKILATENLFSDENCSELSQLRSRALALHNQVDNILNLVDK